jgi:SmpA / OmlA family
VLYNASPLRSSETIFAVVVIFIQQFTLLLVELCFGELCAAFVIGSYGWRALQLLTAIAESSRVIGYLQENEIRIMTLRKICILLSLLAGLLVPVSCNHSVVTGSKLTLSNYDQITTGMTKAQVERILGPPTTVETKDMMIFKKTIYRYEDGKNFAMFTFKNDELDSKEGNLQRER